MAAAWICRPGGYCEWGSRSNLDKSTGPMPNVVSHRDVPQMSDLSDEKMAHKAVSTAYEMSTQQVRRRETAERQLWWWNVVCGSIHLAWAIACLFVGLSNGTTASGFQIVAITSYPDWNQSPAGPVVASQVVYTVPFTALTSGFAWMAAAGHLAVIFLFPLYLKDLRVGVNRFRWLEYGASSSLMMVLVAMLFGVWDVHLLFLIGVTNVVMNTYFYLHERYNTVGKEVDWTHFIFSVFIGIAPWAVILSYANSTQAGKVPVFVWAILILYILLFLAVPLNMFFQYNPSMLDFYGDEVYGFPGGGYYYGEKVYQVLSLLSKSILLWLVVGGTSTTAPYNK